MSNELVPFKVNLPAVSKEQLSALDEVAKGADFLSRIQLITKGKYVDTGKIAPGHWGVPLPGGEEIEDLGESFDIVPWAVRPKALDMADKEAIVAVYDTKDPEFQRIKNAPKNTGCMWGPSFLILERSTGKLYELFFGNKSGRNEAGKLKPFLPTEANNSQPSPATLNIRYKKTPELVLEFLKAGPEFTAPGKYIVFKRWDELSDADEPAVAAFFNTPDVIAGLYTLSGFDVADPNAVIAPFGAGCATIVQHPYLEKDKPEPRSVLGMFDVSARPCVDAATFTFATPMTKLKTMVANMDESFLITPSWAKVRRRIEKAQ